MESQKLNPDCLTQEAWASQVWDSSEKRDLKDEEEFTGHMDSRGQKKLRCDSLVPEKSIYDMSVKCPFEYVMLVCCH